MKKIVTLIVFVAILSACGGGEKSNLKSGFFDFPKYFASEINALDLQKPELSKTIAINGIPQSFNSDSVKWKEELQIFLKIDLNAVSFKDKYELGIDSNAALAIIHYTAKDTNSEIQEVNMTRKNGKIELIEAILKTRSFIVDRDTRLSYQPHRGYGIRIKENYIWSKPKETEIFAEIDGSGFLIK